MKPKRIMVRVAFVSLLIAGLVMVGAVEVAGAEDNKSPRSPVLATVMDEVRPEPVPKRKLSSKSSNAPKVVELEAELKSVLRALVIDKAIALYQFSTQESQSSMVGNRRKLDMNIKEDYPKEACYACVNVLVTGGNSIESERPAEFCSDVVNIVLERTALADERRGSLVTYCTELLLCPTIPGDLDQATACCQNEGMCL